MNTIGVKQLKSQATQILRSVREDLDEYIISVRGIPVAVLKPLTPDLAAQNKARENLESLELLDDLALRIQESWKADVNVTEMLETDREARCR